MMSLNRKVQYEDHIELCRKCVDVLVDMLLPSKGVHTRGTGTSSSVVPLPPSSVNTLVSRVPPSAASSPRMNGLTGARTVVESHSPGMGQSHLLLQYLDWKRTIQTSTTVGRDGDRSTDTTDKGTEGRVSSSLVKILKALFMEMVLSDQLQLRKRMVEDLSACLSPSIISAVHVMQKWCRCAALMHKVESIELTLRDAETSDLHQDTEENTGEFSDVYHLIRRTASIFVTHVHAFLRSYVVSVEETGVDEDRMIYPEFSWADWIPCPIIDDPKKDNTCKRVGEDIHRQAEPCGSEAQYFLGLEVQPALPSSSLSRERSSTIIKRRRDDEEENDSLVVHSFAKPSRKLSLFHLFKDTYSLWKAVSVPRSPQLYGPFSYFYSTGCPGIDAALSSDTIPSPLKNDPSPPDKNSRTMRFGGCRSGLITEVFGVAGSGKTQLLLQLLCTEAAKLAVRKSVAAALEDEFSDYFEVATEEAWSTTSSKDNIRKRQASQSLPPLLYDALLEYAKWDRDVYRDRLKYAVQKVLVYLVAEDMPTFRLQQIAAGCASSVLKRYFDDFSSSNLDNKDLNSHSYVNLYAVSSPLASGRFPVTTVKRVRDRVCEQLTTEHILSHIFIYRIRNGLEELHDLLSPVVSNQMHDPLHCLTLANLIRLQANKFTPTSEASLSCDRTERTSAGLIALDSLAAVVQQSVSSETLSHQPASGPHPDTIPQCYPPSDAMDLIDGGMEDDRDLPSSTTSTTPRSSEVRQAELVQRIGGRLHQLCLRYGISVVVSNQIRAFYRGEDKIQSESQCDMHAMKEDWDEEGIDISGPPTCCLSAVMKKAEYISTPLGLSWAVIPHVRIQLSRELSPSTPTRKSTLVRWLQICCSPYSATRRVFFQICEQGVNDDVENNNRSSEGN